MSGDQLTASDQQETGGRPSPYLVVAVLWTLLFAMASQAMVVAPILPRIGETLAVPDAYLGTLVTAYAGLVGVFALVAGPVSDRVGRRRILLGGAGVLSAALALHGVAWDFGSLLAARALAGAAGGVLNGAAVAYVGDYFPPERRGWANGWVIAGIASGQILGIPAGVLVADRFGFRWTFVGFAVPTAVAAILVWRLLPRPDAARDRSRLTVRNAVAGYAGLVATPRTGVATGLFVLLFAAGSLYTTYLPTWLEVGLDATPATVATLFLVAGVVNAAASPVAGWLADRLGRKPVVVGASVGVTLFTSATAFPRSTLPVAALFVLVMAMFAARSGPLMTQVSELVGDDRRGSLLSLATGLGQMGAGLGGALAGVAYGTVGYPATAAVAGGLMLVGVLVVWGFLPETVDGGATGDAAREVIQEGS